MLSSGPGGGLKRPRDCGTLGSLCVPCNNKQKVAEESSTAEAGSSSDGQQEALLLGSVRVDFQSTHADFCEVESHRFCYAKCGILKKKVSKMLRGTAAINITAQRQREDSAHPIVILCNGTAIGSFSGATAAVLASGLDSGQLLLEGGRDKGTWSEADFDVLLVPCGDDEEAIASEWTRRLKEQCDDFEVDVPAEERVHSDCGLAGCDYCR